MGSERTYVGVLLNGGVGWSGVRGIMRGSEAPAQSSPGQLGFQAQRGQGRIFRAACWALHSALLPCPSLEESGA